MVDFFSVPREIRDLIYEHLVVSEVPIILHHASNINPFLTMNHDNLGSMNSRSGSSRSWDEESEAQETRMAHEAQETSHRINTFAVTYPAMNKLRQTSKQQECIPRELVGPDAWIRHAVVNLDSTNPITETGIEWQTAFLRSLMRCTRLKTLEIQICGPYGDFNKLSAKFIEIARMCTQLQLHFGQNFKFGIMGLWYAVPSYNTVKRTLNTDMTWIFSPFVADETDVCEHEMTRRILKESIPGDLARTSLWTKAYQSRCQDEDRLVRALFLVAYAVQMECPSSTVPKADVAPLKRKLRDWLRWHRVRRHKGSDQLQNFLTDYKRRHFGKY